MENANDTTQYILKVRFRIFNDHFFLVFRPVFFYWAFFMLLIWSTNQHSGTIVFRCFVVLTITAIIILLVRLASKMLEEKNFNLTAKTMAEEKSFLFEKLTALEKQIEDFQLIVKKMSDRMALSMVRDTKKEEASSMKKTFSDFCCNAEVPLNQVLQSVSFLSERKIRRQICKHTETMQSYMSSFSIVSSNCDEITLNVKKYQTITCLNIFDQCTNLLSDITSAKQRCLDFTMTSKELVLSVA